MAANVVEIILKVTGAAAAQTQIKAVQSAMSGFQQAWSQISGALAAAGITTALRAMVRAAEESRVATFQLARALELAGQSSEASLQAFSEQASSLQDLTGVSVQTVMAVQKVILSMGATADQASRLTPLVLDVAATMGTEATTAARQLAAALDGQEVTLGKLNIKAKNADELFEQLEARFGGQAKALMEARGPMAELSIVVGDLGEQLGELINQLTSPAVSKAVDAIRSMRDAASGILALRGMGGTLQAMVNEAAVSSPVVNPGGFGGFDEESAAIEAEILRQATASRELLQVQANINNQFAFRRALVESDPLMSQADRERALLGIMRDELPVLQEREDLLRAEYERQLRADPGRTLETTIEAEGRLSEAQLERLRTLQQIQAIERDGTFSGQMAKRVGELSDAFGNMAKNMANVTFETVTAGVRGLGDAITSIIMQSKTAAQAFTQFGVSMLSNFINMVVTSILYAKVAIPILTALGVLSAGTTAATGAAVTTSALAAGSAAAAAATSGGFASGGYTGDGPTMEVAGAVHRGEFVVPAWRTRELGVANLEAMTFGRSGGGAPAADPGPMRVVIVDDRRSAEKLMRDSRFRNFIVDMQQG